MKPPLPGEKLHNGAILIASRRFRDTDLFVVLAMRVEEEFFEYVTWFYRNGNTFWGHYHGSDILGATLDFEDRKERDDERP